MNDPGIPAFQPFGFDHWVVLLVTLVAVLLLLTNAKRIRSIADDRIPRRVLAAILVLNMGFAFFYYLHIGILKLPLQLCDLAVFVVAVALINKTRWVGEVAFFWGVAGSSQAVLTPDLKVGFPSVQFCQFFFSHCAVILAAVYLFIRGRVRLDRGSVWRAMIAVNIYAIIVGIINWRFGLNFGYLAAKPEQPSVLDLFGPWPYYILGEQFIALALFSVCYLFGLFIDCLAGVPSGKVANLSLGPKE